LSVKRSWCTPPSPQEPSKETKNMIWSIPVWWISWVQNKLPLASWISVLIFLGIILIHSRWMDDKRLRTALQEQHGGTLLWSTLAAISTCHPSTMHHLCMAPPRVDTSELPSRLYTATLCCSFCIDCPLESHYQQTILLVLLLTSSSQSITVLYFTSLAEFLCFVLR